eukprot:522521-Alexandrium_andersonii.AAC.1
MGVKIRKLCAFCDVKNLRRPRAHGVVCAFFKNNCDVNNRSSTPSPPDSEPAAAPRPLAAPRVR